MAKTPNKKKRKSQGGGTPKANSPKKAKTTAPAPLMVAPPPPPSMTLPPPPVHLPQETAMSNNRAAINADNPVIRTSGVVKQWPGGLDTVVVAVLHPGEKAFFWGAARALCLAGQLTIDGFEMKPCKYSTSNLVPLCAPQREGRPLLMCCPAVTSSNPFKQGDGETEDYNHYRLKHKIKEVTPHFDAVMAYVDRYRAAVIVVEKAPTPQVEMIDAQKDNMWIPKRLLNGGRTQWCEMEYASEKEPLWGCTHESDVQMEAAVAYVEQRRAEGARTVIVPVGAKNAGKSAIMRALINTLHRSDRPPVYLIDMDPGQTEMTPFGVVSLWKIEAPLLDLPFTHQARVFQHSYFLGELSPSAQPERYKQAFEALHTAWLSSCEPGGTLIVNTMGWVEDLGLSLLMDILERCRPNVLLQCVGNVSNMHDYERERAHNLPCPAWVQRTVKVFRRMNEATGCAVDLLAPQLREWSLLSYLVPLLPDSRPVLAALTERPPYRVKLSAVTLCVAEDLRSVPDECYVAGFNCQLVGLCCVQEADMKEHRRRLLDSPTLPWAMAAVKASPLMRCLGYGIVRAIDMDAGVLYLLTPLPMEELRRVNVLARTQDTLLPLTLLRAQIARDIPYVVQPSAGGANTLNSDLYGQLKVSTGWKRQGAVKRRQGGH